VAVLADHGRPRLRQDPDRRRGDPQGRARIEFPNLIGATADDARDIMIEGESGILAICPPWERPSTSRRSGSWRGRTARKSPDLHRRRAGAAARQAAHVAVGRRGRRVALPGSVGPGDARAAPRPEPAGGDHDDAEADAADPRAGREPDHCVVTRGSTYDNIANLAPAFADEIIRKYEGTRLGRQELRASCSRTKGSRTGSREASACRRAVRLPASRWTSAGRTRPLVLRLRRRLRRQRDRLRRLYQPGLPSEIAPCPTG
jgi:hypothetical protein